MASYEVAYLIPQRKEAHTIGEYLIKPAAVAMCRAMHGEKVARDLDTIPLSNDTVRRRIHDIADDIRCQLIERVKNVRYALQADKFKSSDFIWEIKTIKFTGGGLEQR